MCFNQHNFGFDLSGVTGKEEMTLPKTEKQGSGEVYTLKERQHPRNSTVVYSGRKKQFIIKVG